MKGKNTQRTDHLPIPKTAYANLKNIEQSVPNQQEKKQEQKQPTTPNKPTHKGT